MKVSYIPDFLFDGDTFHTDVPITVSDGVISSLDIENGAKEVKISGTLAPGFVDLQVNGGGGLLFNHFPTLSTLEKMISAHSRYGTTSMLPTVITSDISTIRRAADAVSEAISKKLPGVIGIHFEGPHISAAKKGIHDASQIRELSDEEMAIYSRQDLGYRLLTVAPENVSSRQIHQLKECGVKVCIGHSGSTYQRAMSAISAGATGFTHLFNAMSPLTSREPGVVGAALTADSCWCGIIMDGLHVHEATANIALKCKPKGKLFLVTDAMSTIGSNQSCFELDGREITLSDGALTDASGTLAGSALDMVTAVNNSISALGMDVGEALRMASRYPGNFLDENNEFGTLMPGKQANFTQLITHQGRLQVQHSWINGQPYY
ncbi:N-acetylglucosamine-6-phosphate deacetylase [Alteromonas sp. CNT1-28]|jgi:N-acetylglucosamine-6-phosphate deacetylase|uniref:N-acetylglucosamine-6-phosphate deacetylase n=1 Tax=Alteromonas sp. CNT1-28 TaxID=2917730 RepID=UPI00144890BC|nr:N-acetylglucosamine-6-phosphate deacetylase [Alteromonas sp. CNT1-28]MCH2257017.1 N-acetylglucosamine-6-phosphate deacetylase [Alteromonas sp.]NKX04808.1 N-acetylglucosamine-6-phosphate deacetylase [Alteromonadaceae bacterium A_SAG6]NKX18082.1 N-acetylglucosamine-6-phosphate deacetylase [Alteromonadaceae bacterium A_SAG5]NKX19297.1 N-acetylglucosamine-6-phosphate deacetylase [Alteromonadaceae bacterium A_SAG8]NKX35091.1 N-acetylglucosamine-6-phosphate deacetylase [Alteromonadaceae bacterium